MIPYSFIISYLQESDYHSDQAYAILRNQRRKIQSLKGGIGQGAVTGSMVGALAGGLYNKYKRKGSFWKGAGVGGLIGAGVGVGSGLGLSALNNKQYDIDLKQELLDIRNDEKRRIERERNRVAEEKREKALRKKRQKEDEERIERARRERERIERERIERYKKYEEEKRQDAEEKAKEILAMVKTPADWRMYQHFRHSVGLPSQWEEIAVSRRKLGLPELG